VQGWGALTRRAEQPTNARGEGPTGLAAIPRNENGPLDRGARVVLRSASDQAATERLFRLPRGTYEWTGSCCQQYFHLL